MLNSRYIHLHEALGLGPLWLKRGAHVEYKPLAPQSPAVIPSSTVSMRILSKESVAGMSVRLKSGSSEDVVTHLPVNTSADSGQAHIRLRTVYAVTESLRGRTAWLTLRPTLNTAAGEIDKGEFGKLLTQMVCAVGSTPAVWQSLPESASSPPTCLDILHTAAVECLVFLGEDIAAAIYPQQYSANIPTITLPHPARLLRQGMLKKNAWQALSHFFFGEST